MSRALALYENNTHNNTQEPGARARVNQYAARKARQYRRAHSAEQTDRYGNGGNQGHARERGRHRQSWKRGGHGRRRGMRVRSGAVPIANDSASQAATNGHHNGHTGEWGHARGSPCGLRG